MTSNMNLTINNKPNSGATSDQIYVCILGSDPSDNDKFGYLNFATGKVVFKTKSDWKLDPATMVSTLDKIKFPLAVPKINSARIYFSVYDNFAPFSPSGPTASKGNNILFDKIEFDNSSDPNINGTSVDFYGISYVISGYDRDKGNVLYGFTRSRSEIINALNKFKPSPDSQHIGNTGIIKRTFMRNSKNEVLRVLAPKSMGLGDWGSTESEFVDWATKCSHFFDDYVAKQCLRGGRKFSFYSKDYIKGAQNKVYWGTTPKEGGLINLWTNEACTEAYQPVPTLNLPAAPWPLPDFTPLLNQEFHPNTITSMVLKIR